MIESSYHDKNGVTAVAGAVLVVCALSNFQISPANSKNIDLSTRSDPAGTFEIGFCARPSPSAVKGWPGHAFVSFSWEKPNRDHEFTAIGHTVTPGTSALQAAWSLFGSPVSGMLKPELYTSAMQGCLTVKVNREDYERTYALTKSPLQKLGVTRAPAPVFEAYKLDSEDCVTWMISVANELKRRGLIVPLRGPTDAPMGYMQQLVRAN